MSLRARIIVVATVMAVLGAGSYYLRTLGRHIFIEPSKRAEEAARAKLSEFALQSKQGANQTVTAYFPLLDEGKLVAESRPIAWAESDSDRVRQVVLVLAEGSRRGSGHLLPPSSVRGVFLASDGTAYVDLSSDVLTELAPGIRTESLLIYSLVNSITTNIPSVKKVQFLIQGQQVETLDGHADLTAAFLPDPTWIKSGL